jgi:thioredoxin-related protein
MKYILLVLFPCFVFAQKPAETFAVFGNIPSKRISIDQLILHIRKLKATSQSAYGASVDFYYRQIAATGNSQWMEKLEEFSLDPACTAKKRAQIKAHIERIRTLSVGEKVPEIAIDSFRLSLFTSHKNSVLLLFYSPSCFHCTELLIDLIPYSEKVQLPVISLQIDEEMNPWHFPSHWEDLKATQKVRKDYGVFSTPNLFLIQSKSKRIIGIPQNVSELKELEKQF